MLRATESSAGTRYPGAGTHGPPATRFQTANSGVWSSVSRKTSGTGSIVSSRSLRTRSNVDQARAVANRITTMSG